MTPVAALERVMHCLDRSNQSGFKAKAFSRALHVVRSVPHDELASRASAGTLTELDGIGESSASVIAQAIAGGPIDYLNDLEAATAVPLSDHGAPYRAALRGDLHMHSHWSDGTMPVLAMASTAIALGHEYIVLTDHSPRLTVAHGLNEERLMAQLDEIATLNEQLAPFRILTGIEVDILEDGSLDHTDEVLERLDLVVASVHSKLSMPELPMTARMVRAISNPHVDVLGHCTGRMVDKREPSKFDIDRVFAACAASRTAVEINCRYERLDPPRAMLQRAVELGCYFSIDSDAHATGHMELQALGCDRAAEAGVPIDRILNTWPLDVLLRWVAGT